MARATAVNVATRLPRSATLGALALLGGGLLMYWAFSGWGLFGLGNGKLRKGPIPKENQL